MCIFFYVIWGWTLAKHLIRPPAKSRRIFFIFWKPRTAYGRETFVHNEITSRTLTPVTPMLYRYSSGWWTLRFQVPSLKSLFLFLPPEVIIFTHFPVMRQLGISWTKNKTWFPKIRWTARKLMFWTWTIRGSLSRSHGGTSRSECEWIFLLAITSLSTFFNMCDGCENSLMYVCIGVLLELFRIAELSFVSYV